MGRASKEDAMQNRQRVLATASSLFRAHGVENVSIADIMGETGLTQGAFYKQFGSRQALIDEAFELAFQQALGSWSRVLDGKDDDEALRDMFRHYFRQRPAEYNCPMLMFSSLVRESPTDSTTAAAYRHGVEELYDEFPAPDTAPEKAVLFAAMIGTGFISQAMGHTPWVEQFQSTVLNAVTHPGESDTSS